MNQNTNTKKRRQGICWTNGYGYKKCSHNSRQVQTVTPPGISNKFFRNLSKPAIVTLQDHIAEGRAFVDMPETYDVKQGFQTVDHNGWFLLDGRQTSNITAPFARENATARFGTSLPDATECYPCQPPSSDVLGSITGSNSVTIAQEHLPPRQSTHTIAPGSFSSGNKTAIVPEGSFNPGTGTTTIPSGYFSSGQGEATIPAGAIGNGNGSGIIPQAQFHSGLNVTTRCDVGSLHTYSETNTSTEGQHSHTVYSIYGTNYATVDPGAWGDFQISYTDARITTQPEVINADGLSTPSGEHSHTYSIPNIPNILVNLPIEGFSAIPPEPYTLNVALGSLPANDYYPTVNVGPIPFNDYFLNYNIGPVPNEEKVLQVNVGDIPATPYLVTVDNKEDMNTHTQLDNRPRSLLVNFFIYLGN